ncbi:odorant receptor 49b-like [Anopheles cruzii]|uniref:odorant receptor 49b-like n=1 Tax=Anopheles cruzii TaxID=68878 RepID=UPI0022EC5454|nr:odorant receptor 49b-like [Anopheles cruzii]
MVSLRPDDETAVMPLILQLLRLIGVWGDGPVRYRFGFIFSIYFFGLMVPKLLFGYPSLEAAVRGCAELILETNVYWGTLLFVMRHDHFVALIEELQAFVKIVFRDYQPMSIGSYLIVHNYRIHKYNLVYCVGMITAVTAYCMLPIWDSVTAYLYSGNGSTVEFHLLMEEGFYGLDHRTSFLDYWIYTAFMVPINWANAYTGAVKCLAIFDSIKYCETIQHVVVMKLEHLRGLPSLGSERVEAMAEILELHQRALRCAELLELVLQPVMLTQFVLCILIWCTMMLYFVVSGINSNLLNMMILFLYVTIETFGYCYLGTKLSEKSLEVGTALYATDWYTFDCKMQRNVRFMIMRSQRASRLTAGKFAFVDMEGFGAMVNMSYSCFVVLKDLL